MNNSEREEFDRKVLAYFKAKGTLYPSEVARHFKKKWETAYNSLRRLTEKGLIFYHPEISRSPMCFSIWEDFGDNFKQRYFGPSQQSKNGNGRGNSTSTTFDCSRFDEGIVRGTPVQIIEKRGFVNHPSMKGKDLPRTFVRAHLHGQYFVDIKTVGTMPETFLIPDTEITGGWMKRKMKGNDCYFGHLKFPEDRMDFKFHAMSDKDGHLKGLSVYVHPRYIYYEDNERTAAIEFRQQVKDVISVLERHGWGFGTICPKGNYSMAINDPILASHVPKDYTQNTTDSVLYDSSPMSADGVCTEAELVGTDRQTECDVLVELPQRILSLEANAGKLDARITSLNSTMDKMVNVLSTAIPHMENLTKTVRDLSIVTEFNSNAIFGTSNPIPTEQPYIAKSESKGDAMYG